jgi:hypothetical protein
MTEEQKKLVSVTRERLQWIIDHDGAPICVAGTARFCMDKLDALEAAGKCIGCLHDKERGLEHYPCFCCERYFTDRYEKSCKIEATE